MRARHLVTAAAIVVIVGGLVLYASLPTGASTRAAIVPADARVVATRPVGAARVLLLSQRGRLRLLVAYHRSKGWFGAPVNPAPQGSPLAWAATRGSGAVPALAALYGRVDADDRAEVSVRWADGRLDVVHPSSDGAYLVARRGRVRAAEVTVAAADGRTTTLGAP
jgi:hypothetical protein